MNGSDGGAGLRGAGGVGLAGELAWAKWAFFLVSPQLVELS